MLAFGNDSYQVALPEKQGRISVMNSLKAILSGIIFIFIAALLMQLAYLFIAVGYNNLAKDYPYLKEISWVFRYLVAIPAFLGIMFAGGYLTSLIANSKGLLHSGFVGSVTMFTMVWFALGNAELSLKGIIINLLFVVFAVFGGWYQLRRSRK